MNVESYLDKLDYDNFNIESFFSNGGTAMFESEAPLNIENEELLDLSYDNEFRYVNMSPQKVKLLLEVEKDPEEIKAMKLALEAFKKMYGVLWEGVGIDAYRGENIQAREIKELRELL